MKERLKQIGRKVLPISVYKLRAKLRGHNYVPPTGRVRFGDLQQVKPISSHWGYDRGSPIDRYYIEQFLSACAADIHGHVLEIEDDRYTRQFGGDRLNKSDVLHVKEGNPHATIVADLTCADNIPSDTFDCIILTQTLQVIYDLRAAIQTLYRILKPGGIVLATVPGITQISHYTSDTDTWTPDSDNWTDYWCWSFTTLSAQKVFAEAFPKANIKVQAYGNVFVAISFLEGLAIEELHSEQLSYHDPDYQVLITVKAVKPQET